MLADTATTIVGVAALALFAAFGGATASFACVVIERRRTGGRATGRSACVCGAPIPLWRNIPVITWIAQRGRAACCGARIPRWYVAAESGTAAAAAVGALLVEGSPFAGALTGILLAVAVTAIATGYHRQPHPILPATNKDDD